MSEVATPRMTTAQFLRWNGEAGERVALIDGVPAAKPSTSDRRAQHRPFPEASPNRTLLTTPVRSVVDASSHCGDVADVFSCLSNKNRAINK